MAVVEQALMVIGVVGLVFVISAGVAAAVVVRRVRRRYRAARARLVAVRAWQPDLPSLVRTTGSVAVSTVGAPGWWVVQSRRHRVWRAVSSAEHAVTVARKADAPFGDLPALARRLRATASGIDAVLRANGAQAPLREEDRRDCDRIVAAASEIRAAAMSSLRSGSHADTDSVVSAVRIEVAALAAGVRAAHF